MKRFIKISLVIVLCLAALLAVGITLTIGWRPIIGPRSRPLTNRVFERTPQRWARGKYLVENEAACADCHSPHEWTKHDAPITQAGMRRHIDAVEQRARFGRIEHWRLSGCDDVPRPAHRVRRINRHDPGRSPANQKGGAAHGAVA